MVGQDEVGGSAASDRSEEWEFSPLSAGAPAGNGPPSSTPATLRPRLRRPSTCSGGWSKPRFLPTLPAASSPPFRTSRPVLLFFRWFARFLWSIISLYAGKLGFLAFFFYVVAQYYFYQFCSFFPRIEWRIGVFAMDHIWIFSSLSSLLDSVIISFVESWDLYHFLRAAAQSSCWWFLFFLLF